MLNLRCFYLCIFLSMPLDSFFFFLATKVLCSQNHFYPQEEHSSGAACSRQLKKGSDNHHSFHFHCQTIFSSSSMMTTALFSPLSWNQSCNFPSFCTTDIPANITSTQFAQKSFTTVERLFFTPTNITSVHLVMLARNPKNDSQENCHKLVVMCVGFFFFFFFSSLRCPE